MLDCYSFYFRDTCEKISGFRRNLQILVPNITNRFKNVPRNVLTQAVIRDPVISVDRNSYVTIYTLDIHIRYI